MFKVGDYYILKEQALRYGLDRLPIDFVNTKPKKLIR